MESRKLAILLSLAAVAMAIALWITYDRVPDRQLQQTQVLLPGLGEQINKLSAVQISRGELATRIRLHEGSWVIEQKDDYPADAGKLRQLLLKLSEARVIEEKTSNPELYSRLGVEDADNSETGGGVLVTVQADGTQRGLIIGKRAMGDVGTYVRRQGEPQSLLADQVLEPEPDAGDWMIRDLMDVPPSRIQRVEIQHADGEQLVLKSTQAGQGEFDMENIPAGRELSSSFAANGIGSVLSKLQLEDARRLPADAGKPQARARFTLKNGTLIQANVRGEGDQSWVDFEVIASETGNPQQDADSAAAEASADATPDQGADPDAAQIRAVVRGWQFRLPAHKMQQLSRRVEDLLKKAP